MGNKSGTNPNQDHIQSSTMNKNWEQISNKAYDQIKSEQKRIPNPIQDQLKTIKILIENTTGPNELLK
jgi:hypothetical protein